MKKIANMNGGARRMRRQVLRSLNDRLAGLALRYSWSDDPTSRAMAAAMRDAIRAVEAMR